MSLESAKAFFERMNTDEGFAKKVNACKDKAECLALMKKEGFDFSAQEAKNASGELSEADLERVSGGTSRVGWYFAEG